jgi:uncharacterized protein YndB with AHSA1/START domain
MKNCVNVPARRNAIAAIAGAVGSVAYGAWSPKASAQQANPSETSNAHRTSLHQQIDLPAPPKRVFEALMDAKQFAALTGMPATIDPSAGGSFKTFGGLIEGRNVELIPSQRIVQAWREASWEPGFYSLVHFELTAQDRNTTLVLDHSGFHEGDFGHLDPGWHQRYWDPLKRYLAVPS